MPKSPDAISASSPAGDDCLLPQEVLRELRSLSELVRNAVAGKKDDGAALALVRTVKGLTPQAWAELAARHSLEDWLAVPLECSLADSVGSLLALQEKLVFQRDHDPLTGAANRGLFNRRLEAEVDRALRGHTDLTLLMLDLDNFKKVNDTYGHPCGDAVLQRLAAHLAKSVRPYDTAARVGGEEFAIILPGMSCWTGIVLGNRILASFRNEEFTCGGAHFSMTFSAGAAGLLQFGQKPTPEGLVAAADAALYEAKRQGKNRVCAARSEKAEKDKDSLVQAGEKRFLFSLQDEELI